MTKGELFHEIWEVLTLYASCDREATDWTDQIMTRVNEYLETRDEE